MNKKKGFRRITILLSIFSGVVALHGSLLSLFRVLDRRVGRPIEWVGVGVVSAIGVALPWLVYFVVRWIFRGFTASESIEKLKGGNE